jgi:PQQ-dependent dehydrogenase (s-GDH family)
MRSHSACLVAAVALAAAVTVAGRERQGVGATAGGQDRFSMRVVASGLEAPWEIAWGPDTQLWITEREGGRVIAINPADGSRRTLVSISEVHQSASQDGLLGLALHPDLLRGNGNDYVYVAFTYDDAPGTAVTRRMAIRRYQYAQASRTLTNPVDLLTGLPAHDDHVAGRLAIGPDRKLYLSIGDQGSNFGANRCNPNRAQELPTPADLGARNWSAYQGKILRIDLDGSIPADNPAIGGVRSHVFSYGHRNPLGLAFAPDGRLYESEHGPSSDDEVNLIEAGGNYGWPNVAGFRDDKSYIYGNWSASSPQPCASVPYNPNRIPASVPTEAETSWSHPAFKAPLKTFFTVDTGFDVSSIGSATIAPGGLDVYVADGGIPGWTNSLLVLSLIRGTVYRVPLGADGRPTDGQPIETFTTANRYRDIALGPDRRTFYLATDMVGPSRGASGRATQTLANPGSVLEFTYTGNERP